MQNERKIIFLFPYRRLNDILKNANAIIFRYKDAEYGDRQKFHRFRAWTVKRIGRDNLPQNDGRVYHHSKIAAYVCDNRLLVKPVEAAFSMMPSARLEPPYAGAKDMLLVDDLDDKRFLIELFEAMYPELPEPKPKKTKR